MDKNLINPDAPIFPISVAAQQLNVHQRTLTIYDAEKILCPKRTSTNRRLYSLNDIKKGEFIQYLIRKLGLNLVGIKIILALLKNSEISKDDYKKIINNADI